MIDGRQNWHEESIYFCRMGGKLEDLDFKKRNFQPGPGRYDNEKQHSIPSMKFGTGMRTSLDSGKEGKFKPGPGVYSADPTKV